MKKNIKRIVSSVLAFVIAFGALTIVPGDVLHAWYASAAELFGDEEAGAEETYQSGEYTYSLINEYTNVKLLSYSGSEENLVIPDTIDGKYVTALGASLFYGKSFLKTVTLPKRLETIGDSAFTGCTSLTAVSCPDSLKSIGSRAFSGDTALKSVSLEEGVTSIGSYAFSYCKALESIELPATLTSMGPDTFSQCTGMTSAIVNGTGLTVSSYAFEYCYALQSITFGEGVKSIGYRACYDCGEIQSITLPDSLETIEEYAFPNTKVTSLTFGESLKSIGGSAFSNARRLQTITIGKNLTTIGSNAFYQATALESVTVDPENPAFCDVDGVLMNKEQTALVLFPKSRQGELTIPDSVTAIANNAFESCAGLTKVTIGDNVTTIGSRAFAACPELTEVVIGDGVTNIEADAFSNCGKLAAVTFGSAVASIGSNAFSNCTALTAVSFPASLRSIGGRVFSGDTALKSVSLEEGVTSIGSYAFSYCKALESIELPATLTSMGTDVFSQCTGMTSATVNGTGLTVSSYAFEYCYALQSITFGEGVRSIGYRACYDCGEIQSISLPDSLETIEEYAFPNTKVTSLTFGESLKSIGGSAFSNARRLQTITIGKNLTTIGSNAFYQATALENITVDPDNAAFCDVDGVLMNKEQTALLLFPKSRQGEFTIPDSVTTIGSTTFESCPGLTKVTIGDNVTTIGSRAFAACPELTEVVIGDGVTAIEADAFSNCGKLAKVTFGSAVASIGNNAFSNCTALTAVSFPASLRSIGSRVFSGDTALKSVSLEEGVTSIGSYAFSYCKALESIELPATLTSMGTDVFSQCTGMTSAIVNGNSLTVSSYAFEYCYALQSITFGEGVKSIGYRACYDCGEIQSISLPDSLETIEEYAFPNTKVTSLTFGESLKSIGGSAFSNARRLQTITIGKNLTTIGSNAFYQATALENITVDPDNATFCDVDGVLMNKEQTALVLFPKSRQGELTIPDSVTSIGSTTFESCTGLTKVTIGDNVTAIGSRAFAACPELTEVVIGDGVTAIEAEAFSGCGKLAKVTFGSAVASIGSNAFSNCTALTAVSFPASLRSIGNRVFSGDTALKSVSLEEGVTSIGSYAFSYCKVLESIELPATLTSMGTDVFSQCTGMTSAIVNGNSLTVSSYAFEYCYALQSITFGEGVRSIGYRACYDCGSLKKINLSNTVETIEDHAFSNSRSLEEVIFGKNVAAVSSVAFYADASFTALCYEDSPAHDFLKSMPNVTIRFIRDNFYVSDLAIDRLTSGEITISWGKPKGFSDIDRYLVYKNGTKIAETEELTYTDINLTAGKTYTYAVCAVDGLGVVSEKKELEATPACAQVTALSLPYGKTEIGGTTPYTVTASMENGLSRDKATAKFLYSADGESWKEIGDGTANADGSVYTIPWSLQDVASGAYTLRFLFTDKNGGSSFRDLAVSVDRTLPARIDEVSLTPQETVISLAWQISAEADTMAYRIYRSTEADSGFELISEIRNRETLSYTDKKVKENTVYYYYVVGVDGFGQESADYDVVCGGLISDAVSPVFVRMTPADMSFIYGKQKFTVIATDNVGVVRTELYYSTAGDAPKESWSLLTAHSGSSFSETVDTSALPAGVIYIAAKIFDAAGNFTYSPTMTYHCDNTGPEQVRNLRCVSNLGTVVTMAWDDVADDDKSFFVLEQRQADGSFKALGTHYITLGANLSDLTPETDYAFRVVAYDIHGNRGSVSEVCELTTTQDQYPPVVTAVSPEPDDGTAYTDAIDFTVTAADDYRLQSLAVLVSDNDLTWETVKTFAVESESKRETFRYQLDLTPYAEGRIYVKFLCADAAGNAVAEEDVDAAVYRIVRTPCAVPDGLAASSDERFIALSWNAVPSDTLLGYNVFRSDAADGTYACIRSRTQAVAIYDEDVEQGATYFYKVQSVDIAGNLSEMSEAVSCTVTPDTEPPELYGFSPDDGARIGPQNNRISVGAADNSKLERLTLAYKTNGLFDNYRILKEVTGNTSRNILLTATLPMDTLSSGTEVSLRITAADAAGNEMEAKTVRYTIDKDAPEVRDLQLTHEDGANLLRWSCADEDAKCFCVMRRTGDTAEYDYVAKLNAGESGSYTYTDKELGKKRYFQYRVVAYDRLNNTSRTDSEGITVENDILPQAQLSFPSAIVFGSEYLYDASGSEAGSDDILSYSFDFGDGSETVVSDTGRVYHLYSSEGEYQLKLTVKDAAGRTGTAEYTVIVTTRNIVGRTPVRVLDDNFSPLSNADVYLDLGTSSETCGITDAAGCFTFDSTLGTHTFSAYKDGYLPVKTSVAITGDNRSVDLILRKQAIVTGEFEIHKMTFDEIQAAGIRLSDQSNWSTNIVEYKVTLAYEKKPINTSFYFDGTNIIGGGPTEVQTTSGARLLTPTVIDPDGTGKNPLIAYIDVPVSLQYSTLKDFFDVKLHIINHASEEFSLSDSSVKLNLPDGLSIARTSLSGAGTSAKITLGTIGGGSTKTVQWIIRGDKAGEYTLSADFFGTLRPFNKPVEATFISGQKITVSNSTPLDIEIRVSKGQYHAKVFYNLAITNTGDTPVRDIQFLGDSSLSLKESFCTELVTENGATEVKQAVTTLNPGEQLVYHFYSVVSVFAKFREYTIDTVSGSGLDIRVTEYDTEYFTKKYKEKYPEDSDAFILYVQDSSGKPLQNARVDLGNNQIFYSNEDGKVVISEEEKPDINCLYLHVSLDGFNEVKNNDLQGRLYLRRHTVTLYRVGEFAIDRVYINGTDAVNSYVNVVIDPKTSDGNAPQTGFKVECAGETATEMILRQKGKTVTPASVSYDERDNTFDAVFNNADFAEGEGFTLEVVTANTSKSVKLNLKGVKANLRDDFKFPDPKSYFAICELFSREMKFSLPNDIELSYVYNSNDQTLTVAIGHGMLGCEIDSNDFDEILDACEEMLEGKRTKYSYGASIMLGVAGALEISYKTGEPVLQKAVYQITFDAAVKFSQEFALGFVPIVLQEEIGVGAKIDVPLNLNFEIDFTDREMELSYSLKVSIGVGVPHFSTGVVGSASIENTFSMPDFDITECKLVGKLGIYAEAAFFYYAHYFVDDEIYILGDEDGVGALFDLDAYRLNTDLLTRNTAWEQPAAFSEGTSTLIGNADAAQQPQIVSIGDKTLMVYRGVDTSAGSVANALALYYSVLDPATGAWSVPVKVDGNHLSDLQFSLAGNGSAAQLVYTQANRELSDDMEADEMFGSVDVYAASFNTETNTFDTPVRITDNGVYDATPAVTYRGGTPAAVWVANSANNFFMNDSSNALMMSRCENGSWTAPVALEQNAETILSCAPADSSGALVAYVKDADSDLATDSDRTLYLRDTATGDTKILAENIVSVVETGELRNKQVVMWVQNDTLMCYDTASGVTSELSAVSATAANGFRLLSNDGSYSVVYIDGGNTVKQICLDGATGEWSSPVTLVTSENNIQNLEAAYIDGKLDLTYYENRFADDDSFVSDLVTTVVGADAKPVITDVSVDFTSMRKGQPTNAQVKVSNGSAVPTGNLRFEVIDPDGTVLSEFTANDSSLAPGESRLFTVPFTAPEEILNRDIIITVYDATKRSSSSCRFNPACADLELHCNQFNEDGQSYMRAVITNNTDYATPGELEIYNRETDEVYKTVNISEVSAKCPVTVMIPIDRSLADANDVISVRVVSTARDCNEYNNSDLFGYHNISLRKGDLTGDGQVTIDDVTAVQRYLAEMDEFSGDQLICADANSDGAVDILDATHMQRYIAEMISEL